MAKLNGVKVLDEKDGEVTRISYEGAEYEAVNLRPTAKGDLIRIDEELADTTTGGFYKVQTGDKRYARFRDDVRFLQSRTLDDRFALFRKVSASTIEERVGKLEEAVERIEQAATSEASVDWTELTEGAEEVIYDKPAQVGDTIRIVDAIITGGRYENGSVLTVADVDGDGDVRVSFADNPRALVIEEEFEIIGREEAQEAKEPEFKVGDEVRMISEQPQHGFGGVSTGDIGEIASVTNEKVFVDFPEQSHWTANPSEIEHVEQPEEPQAPGESQDLAPGTKVRQPGGTVYTLGERRPKCDVINGSKAYTLADGPFASAWLSENQFEVIPAEDVVFLEAGREPGEYREGDVVEVTEWLGGHDVGTIGVLVDGGHFAIPRKFGVKANGKTCDHTDAVNPIVFVENRLDNEGGV